jgi:TonB family protein
MRWPLVSFLVALLIAGHRSAAAQPPPSSSALAGPLTPGDVAVLVLDRGSPDVSRRLAEAIRHARGDVRAVAARVVTVTAGREHAPALSEALARESDVSAASEQIRALLTLGGSGALAEAAAAADRLGGPVAFALAEFLARSRGAEIVAQLRPLLRSTRDPRALGELLAAVARDRPADRRRVAAGVIAAGDGPLWRAYLASLGRHRIALETGTWLEGLKAPDPMLQTETLLALAAQLMTNESVAESVRAAALPSGSWPPVSPTELDFARELAARAFGKPAATVDWSGLVSTVGVRLPHGIWPRLTEAEQQAARQAGIRPGTTVAHDSTSSLSNGVAPAGRSARIVAPLAPGLWTEMATRSGCRFGSNREHAAARVSYHPDGRPREVSLTTRSFPRRCVPFVNAALSLLVAPLGSPLSGEAPELVYLPLQARVVGCLDRAPSSPAAPPAIEGQPGVIQPQLTREVKPNYSPEAMDARAEGQVWVYAVVNEDGCVSAAHVIRGVHPGLDLEALHAVLQWQFKPGLRDGRPVPVGITVAVAFNLK